MSLTKRQLEALRKNAPTAEDIVGNEGFFQELNEEISSTYDQKKALDIARNDPTLVGVELPPVSQNTNPKVPVKANHKGKKEMSNFDMDAALDRELAEARRLAAEKAEALRKQAEEEKEEVQAQAATKAAEPAKSREELMREQVFSILRNHKDAPTPEQLELLKKQHGSDGIYITAFNENNVFIYTHLKRSQWKRIQEIVQKMSSAQAGASSEDLFKEKVVQYCTIYPKNVNTPEFLSTSRAGLIDSLFEAIMLQSYFLTPNQTMQITFSL